MRVRKKTKNIWFDGWLGICWRVAAKVLVTNFQKFWLKFKKKLFLPNFKVQMIELLSPMMNT